MSDSKNKKPQRTRQPGDILRALTKQLFNSYRPELHYMRGPGPKWREQHAQSARPTPTTIVFGPDTH